MNWKSSTDANVPEDRKPTSHAEPTRLLGLTFKTWATPLGLVMIGSVIAGCGTSGNDDDQSQAQTTEAFVSPIPTVPADQERALIDGLDAIAPGLASEPEDTITNARNTCDSILGGSQTLVNSTKVRFTGDGVDSMTDDQAQQIIDFITAEGWCS